MASLSKRFVPFNPFWDNPIGRFLATHISWFSHRWADRIERALIARAQEESLAAQLAVLVAANRYVAVPNEGFRGNLISAVCRHRNSLVQLERLRHGDEAADSLSEALGVGHPPSYMDDIRKENME